MLKSETCPVCSSQDLSILKEYFFQKPEINYPEEDCNYVTERLWILFNKIINGKNEIRFEISYCATCGFIFSNPRYEPADITAKYDTVSLLPSAKKRKTKNPARKTAERAERIYKLVKNFAPSTCQNVLDYGGAEGYNLSSFIRENKNCFVIDSVKENLMKGAVYAGKDFSEDEKKKYDVILLCHTLEHIPQPTEYLRRISSYLTDEGVLYIEIPLGAWKEFSRLKEPVTHVNFFSEESLYHAAKNAGLWVQYISVNYQWVTHYPLWCINMVCSKNSLHEKVNYRTTTSTLFNYRYQWMMLLKNPAILLNWLKSKVH